QGELSRLIHLYVVGVFTAITFSQAGMVLKWLRDRGAHWRRNIAVNGVGVATTGVVLAIVAVTQFTLGAWIVLAAIPLIVMVFLAIRRHYERVARRLRAGLTVPPEGQEHTFVVLVPDLGLATAEAVAYLRAVRPTRVFPVHIGDPDSFEETSVGWSSLAPRFGELQPLERGTSGLARAVRRLLREHARDPGSFHTVVVPESVQKRSMLAMLRPRAALWLKASLLFEPDVVVTNVPLLPEERAQVERWADHPVEPPRSVVLVPISAVHGATVRAVAYARTLHATTLEALFFSGDAEDVEPVIRAWGDLRLGIPLAVIEDPFRDLGGSLLAEIRKHRVRGDTVVTIVIPEFVVDRWWEHLLHNQTGFYLKRLLLFEPGVVVTSVPFHLGAVPTPERAS
ncbi:MAG: hypothetical protein WD670_00965, partial [Actinomycetota bacterium]